MVHAQYLVKWNPWWYYPLALLSPQGAAIVTEVQVTALALHTACALNYIDQALTLLDEEMYHRRKTTVQNQMALDLLTAAQGGMCALLSTECFVYILDNHKMLQ